MRTKTTGQCEYQLARAREAHRKAAKTGDAAAYERTSDSIGKWEVELKIARGMEETAAINSVFGPEATR